MTGPIRHLFVVVAMAATLLATTSSHAADNDKTVHAIFVGALAHDVDGLWSGFRREAGVDLNAEVVLSPRWDFFGGALRPAIGASLNSNGDTSKLYAAGRWQYDFQSGFFVAAGLGAAVHNGARHTTEPDKKELGSRVLFHIPLEAGYRWSSGWSLSLYFDHMSNAFLADANEGQDTLGVRLGYFF